MKKMNTFFTFTVQVYEKMTPDGRMTPYVEVQVIAENEKEALAKAKKILPRAKYTYRIKMVTEYQLVENDNK